jgi:2-methylisocitrate lyase-like PEP mutase family enzyme
MTATSDALPDAADRLRSLHHGSEPLVLPNAWDAASARLVVAAGFPVVATSSAAVARMLGYEDHDDMPPDEAFAAVARVARAVAVPVTADVEAGYQLPAADVVGRLLDAGAVGCNLEDTDHHGDGVLVPAEQQAERLAAVKEAGRRAGVDVVVNARVDTYARGAGEVEETLRRARLYFEAGADCVYPILLADEAAIAEIVAVAGGPVNVMSRPGAPSLARLGELGVARVSFGSGLARVAYTSFEDALGSLAST